MELLTRNIETLIPSPESFEHLLKEGRKLRIKFGIDPTGPNIHIGRAVALWKLREFQDAGHTIVLLFGDFTARIGDPSDKDKRRPVLGEEQIKENASRYLEQVAKILDVSNVELHYNSEWHDTMSEADLIKLSRLFTVNQMLARRNFSQRIKEQREIGIDELLYPLLQGYDSYALKADVELGGFDQLFNLEAGRVVQSALGQEPQHIIITKMLWGLDGRKMSTSWGNVVNINDDPNDMFGKIMTLDDKLMADYARLATRLSEEEIKEIEKIQHPKEQKERIAEEVVALYHGKEAAQKAQEEFNKRFSKKELPSEIPIKTFPKGSYQVVYLLVQTGLAISKGDAKRLIRQGGIKINDRVIENQHEAVDLNGELLIERGKRQVVKVMAG